MANSLCFQFLALFGWLKVAEQLINPFGEDDDDFELNWMLDRNLFIGMYLADEMHNQFPILVKDSFWNEEEPTLPYTKSSLNLRSKAHLGSAVNIFVGEQDAEFMPLETVMEEEKDDYVLGDLNDNLTTPDVNSYGFNYKTGKAGPDLDGVSVSTTGLRIPDSVPGSKFFNILLGLLFFRFSSFLSAFFVLFFLSFFSCPPFFILLTSPPLPNRHPRLFVIFKNPKQSTFSLLHRPK